MVATAGGLPAAVRSGDYRVAAWVVRPFHLRCRTVLVGISSGSLGAEGWTGDRDAGLYCAGTAATPHSEASHQPTVYLTSVVSTTSLRPALATGYTW